MRLVLVIFLSLLLPVLSACKIRIIVPEGGRVVAESGAYQCESGKTCTIDVVDVFFDETFAAVPAEGYEFRFWRKGHRGFCGGTAKPCHLYTTGESFRNSEALTGLLRTDEVFYLRPVFRKKSDDGSGTIDANADGPGPKRLIKTYHWTQGVEEPDEISYEYHDNGFLWKESLAVPGGDPIITEYFYEDDRLVRLETVTGEGNAAVEVILEYEYDEEKEISFSIATNFANPAIDGGLTTYTHVYKPGSDRPVRSDVDNDGDGKPESKLLYKYNDEDLLETETQVSEATSNTEFVIRHRYNDDGRRLEFEGETPDGVVLYRYELTYEDEACKFGVDRYNYFGECR